MSHPDLSAHQKIQLHDVLDKIYTECYKQEFREEALAYLDTEVCDDSLESFWSQRSQARFETIREVSHTGAEFVFLGNLKDPDQKQSHDLLVIDFGDWRYCIRW